MSTSENEPQWPLRDTSTSGVGLWEAIGLALGFGRSQEQTADDFGVTSDEITSVFGSQDEENDQG